MKKIGHHIMIVGGKHINISFSQYQADKTTEARGRPAGLYSSCCLNKRKVLVLQECCSLARGT